MTLRRLQMLLLSASFGALAFCCLPARAEAETAIVADGVSTAAGLARGATELNPLGYATIPIRFALLAHADTKPAGERQQIRDTVETIGWGAAVNNLLVIAGATGFAPLAVGAAVGVALWQQGAERREFYRLCDYMRKDAPHLKCVYTPSKTATGAEHESQ